MHYDEQNYRLPTESRTPMIQVTHGCSYNKCHYCILYYKTPFAMADIDEIRADIRTLAESGQDIDRIYFMNGDPFALGPDKLAWLIDQVQAQIPSCKSFSMFASIHNIKAKTDEDLAFLRTKGITDLYLGSESFHGPSLDLAGVGYGPEESMAQIERLEAAGIGYSIMMILGLGGAGRDLAKEVGQVNGKTISKLKPINITITSLFVPNNSLYGKWKREGKFIEASESDKALELRTLFENLETDHRSFFYSFHHPSARDMQKFLDLTADKKAFANLYKYYLLKGHIPQDLDRAKDILSKVLQTFEAYPRLKSYPWFDYKKEKYERSDFLTENALLSK